MSRPATAHPAVRLTVLRLAALLTVLACAMGAVVCATKSGASCPTWPGCRPGAVGPPWALSPMIEFTHRVVAVSSGPLVLLAGALYLRRSEVARWVRALPWVALVGAALSGIFGRMVIVATLPTPLAGVDLFCALTAMSLMGVAAVRAARPASTRATPQEQLAGRLATGGTVTVTGLHVTGIFTAGTASYTGCIGWPIWRTVPHDLHPWLQNARLAVAAVAGVIVLATAGAGLRAPRLRRGAITLAALFAGEMVVGLAIRARGIDDPLAASYSVLAVALLSCLGLFAATAGVAATAEPHAPAEPPSRRAELTGPGRR